MEKNTVRDANISAGGDVRIGDNIYNIETQKVSLFPLLEYLEIQNVSFVPVDIRGVGENQEKIISFFRSTNQLLIISGEAETGKTHLINSIVSRIPGYFDNALGYRPLHGDHVELVKELTTYLPKDEKLLNKTKPTQVRLQKILKTLHREAKGMDMQLDEDFI